MHRSTLTARLITIVVALILTPVALALLTTGGTAWLFASYRYAASGFDVGALLGPSMLQLLAIVLLIGVVLTGVWSSAGLLAAGALSIVPLALAVAPMLLPSIFQALPSEATRQLLDSLTYGVALFLLPALGAMGAVLAISRRRPAAGGSVPALLGVVAVPAVLALGGVLTAWGHGAGMLTALREFRFDPDPLAILAVLGGLAAIMGGILLTRRSPFALLLPALFLLGFSALVAVPGSAHWFYLPEASDLSQTGHSVLLLGTGVAAAFAYLAFTVVLLIVRRRARVRDGAEDGAPHPIADAYPPAPIPYPPAPIPYPPARDLPAPPVA